MKHQEILFSNDINSAINKAVEGVEFNRLFILVDVNVDQFVMPFLADNVNIKGAFKILIKAGDVNKNLESLSYIWKQLVEAGATRHSLLLNIGGGMITDIGGFAASTFKRGIKFFNIPTTLLGAVDAAVGGKTGINFNSLKNELGAFREAEAVIISTKFFDTLPLSEIKSGYAEMLKHGLLSSEYSFSHLLDYDFNNPNHDMLLKLLQESVEVKRKVVADDPFEKGIRRALNLGHTVGHAFESTAMQRFEPISHGYAVAWGMLVELILSNMILKFDSNILNVYARFVNENYGVFHITCDDYDALIELMHHDKKSNHGELNFSLLKAVGDVKINCEVSSDDVKVALDIYRDMLHI
ncbi:MAG: 3-dehydroquinate synthase [Muribaculaceae bacterium]|nr:3-dehydroquinate synthase [Muribaculaceae bacterium]